LEEGKDEIRGDRKESKDRGKRGKKRKLVEEHLIW
jgi:hypothetical protein